MWFNFTKKTSEQTKIGPIYKNLSQCYRVASIVIAYCPCSVNAPLDACKISHPLQDLVVDIQRSQWLDPRLHIGTSPLPCLFTFTALWFTSTVYATYGDRALIAAPILYGMNYLMKSDVPIPLSYFRENPSISICFVVGKLCCPLWGE